MDSPDPLALAESAVGDARDYIDVVDTYCDDGAHVLASVDPKTQALLERLDVALAALRRARERAVTHDAPKADVRWYVPVRASIRRVLVVPLDGGE